MCSLFDYVSSKLKRSSILPIYRNFINFAYYFIKIKQWQLRSRKPLNWSRLKISIYPKMSPPSKRRRSPKSRSLKGPKSLKKRKRRERQKRLTQSRNSAPSRMPTHFPRSGRIDSARLFSSQEASLEDSATWSKISPPWSPTSRRRTKSTVKKCSRSSMTSVSNAHATTWCSSSSASRRTSSSGPASRRPARRSSSRSWTFTPLTS